MLTITIDWLALTFKEWTKDAEKFCILYASVAPIVDETPRNGYTTATRDKNGVVCMWNDNRPEMGRHVIFAGSALRNVFEHYALRQRDLVAAAINAGGRISRLDIAKDATDVPINLRGIWQHLTSGDFYGTSQAHSIIENETGGITVYVGSRQSEKFIRMYDKANQLGMEHTEWKRYELETKGMVARALAVLLVDTDEWSGAFDAMALGMVSIPHSKDYQEFFAQGETLVGIPALEKTSDREKWIAEQVVKAVLVHYHEHPESKAVKLLIDALRLAGAL